LERADLDHDGLKPDEPLNLSRREPAQRTSLGTYSGLGIETRDSALS
jgi:hypothetical protein